MHSSCGVSFALQLITSWTTGSQRYYLWRKITPWVLLQPSIICFSRKRGFFCVSRSWYFHIPVPLYIVMATNGVHFNV